MQKVFVCLILRYVAGNRQYNEYNDGFHRDDSTHAAFMQTILYTLKASLTVDRNGER